MNILYWFKLSSVLLVEGSAGYGFSMRSVPGVACLYLITRGVGFLFSFWCNRSPWFKGLIGCLGLQPGGPVTTISGIMIL